MFGGTSHRSHTETRPDIELVLGPRFLSKYQNFNMIWVNLFRFVSVELKGEGGCWSCTTVRDTTQMRFKVTLFIILGWKRTWKVIHFQILWFLYHLENWIQRLHRFWWRVLEPLCVSDSFEILMTSIQYNMLHIDSAIKGSYCYTVIFLFSAVGEISIRCT